MCFTMYLTLYCDIKTIFLDAHKHHRETSSKLAFYFFLVNRNAFNGHKYTSLKSFILNSKLYTK